MYLVSAQQCASGPPLWLTATVAFLGVFLAAVLAAAFHHWAWLRERRLEHFLGLLASFRSAASLSAAAVQADVMGFYDIKTPDGREKLRSYVVPAIDAIEAFSKARDLATIVAPELEDESDTAPPLSVVVRDMSTFIWELRRTAPLASPGTHPRELQMSDFPEQDQKARELAAKFREAVRRDVGSLEARKLLWLWMTSPFRGS